MTSPTPTDAMISIGAAAGNISAAMISTPPAVTILQSNSLRISSILRLFSVISAEYVTANSSSFFIERVSSRISPSACCESSFMSSLPRSFSFSSFRYLSHFALISLLLILRAAKSDASEYILLFNSSASLTTRSYALFSKRSIHLCRAFFLSLIISP